MEETKKITIRPGETIEITCEGNEQGDAQENAPVQTTTDDAPVQTTPAPPNSGGEEDTQASPSGPKERGERQYAFGAITDMHLDTDGDKAEAVADLTNALDYLRQEGVDFIESCGDLCEYEDADMEAFRDIYTVHAWAPTNAQLRFFTSLGNHDYLRLYHRGADIARLLQCFTVFTGEDLWTRYGYKEKTDYIQFFEYDGAWDKQYYGDRTVKSKLSYWFEHKGDIFVNLSIDYGDDTGEVWDEQCRGYHMLDKRDKYVQQMIDYVGDTNYRRENGSLDYQFYHPNALIWLRDILEHNRGRRVFVFWHHFLPHKAGDSDGIYSHLRVWPCSDSKAVRQKYYYGSNTPCGLTFWYLDKLTNEYPNAIFISGHSHREWNDVTSVCRHDYTVRKPTGSEVTPLTDNLESLSGTQYDYRLYQRESETPCGSSAVTVGLPSLSKPVSTGGQTLYGASQGAVIEVYEHAVVIRCIDFKRQGDSRYRNEVIREIELSE